MNIVLLVNGKIGILFAKKINELIDIKKIIIENIDGISNYKDEKLLIYNNQNDLLDYIPTETDIVISYNWNRKIKNNILDKYEVYNFHMSLLPKYRGPIPLVFSIINNEEVLGITFHKVNDKYDDGDIYMQKSFKNSDLLTMQQIYFNMFKLSLKIFNCFIKEYPNIKLYNQNKIGDKLSYFTYKDLNNYIVDNNMYYRNFKLIVKAFDNIIPIKILINDKVFILKEFSEVKTDKCNLCYYLKDKFIFISII